MGLEVNYYPPLFQRIGYANAGLSYTESTRWAFNTSLGINSTGSGIDEPTYDVYLEPGMTLMLSKPRPEPTDDSSTSGVFLPDFSKRILPSVEFGLRVGGYYE